jgi:hypothetical protein
MPDGHKAGIMEKSLTPDITEARRTEQTGGRGGGGRSKRGDETMTAIRRQ